MTTPSVQTANRLGSARVIDWGRPAFGTSVAPPVVNPAVSNFLLLARFGGGIIDWGRKPFGSGGVSPVAFHGGKIQRHQKRYFIELPNGIKVYGSREKLEGILALQRAVPEAKPHGEPVKPVALAAPVIEPPYPPTIYFDDDDEEEALMMLLLSP